jgi:hypothetical protein
LSEHEGKGVKFVYLHTVDLLGNRRILREESIVSDLEYADNIALLSGNWEDLMAMLTSLTRRCKTLGLTTSCKKTKFLAALPTQSHQAPCRAHSTLSLRRPH